MQALFDIGMVGLSVMGRSLALNMADHGFRVAGYNRSREVTEQVMREHRMRTSPPSTASRSSWRPSDGPAGSC